MKPHIVRSLGGLTLLLVAVLLLVAPNWAGAQTAVIPAPVDSCCAGRLLSRPVKGA